jgi:hypothetical protein
MNVVVVVLVSVVIPVAALALYVVQEKLERWEQRKHADD